MDANEVTEGDEWRNALVIHKPTQQLYIIAECALYRHGECVGTRIVACQPTSDFPNPQVDPTTFDRIDAIDLSNATGLAAWAEAEDGCDNFEYPIGGRY